MNTVKLLPEVVEFLAQKPIKMFIGGEWLEAWDKSAYDVINPGTGEVLASVAEAKKVDIDKAVAVARKAFEESGWASMSVKERSGYLYRLAELVEEHAEIFAQLESLDVGKPITAARAGDVPNVPQTIRFYTDLALKSEFSIPIYVAGYEARRVRHPYGVTAFIIPWNYPFLNVGWNLPAPLITGNTTVMKPSEYAPITSLYFCNLVEKVGFPPGVINILAGFGESAGAALANNPDINRMAFTGSPEVGREVGAVCGRNLVPIKLELGGKGAAVIFDDVDVQKVVDDLIQVIILNTGQVCCTASRWVIHENIWDDFIEMACKGMKKIKIGYGMDESTVMGPVISEKQRKRVLGYIEKGVAEGSEVLFGGGKADVEGYPGGYYVKPTIMAGRADNIAAREEIFGPVTFLIKFKTEQEALDIVHTTKYGLANSVWSKDLIRANRVAEAMVAGNGWINGHNIFPSGVQYGGCNLSGLGGGLNGPDTLFDYLRPQSIVRPLD